MSDFGWWAEHVKEEAMKVQRKHGAVETYEVLEESTNYYIIKGSATFVHVVSKADYEPVQEWVDVTKECTWHPVAEQGPHLSHKFHIVGHQANKHRLRFSIDECGIVKVEVKR